MDSRAWVLPLLLLSLASLTTGCESAGECTFTGRLWNNDEMIEHFEPAASPGVKLFRRGQDPEFLVQYNEERESNGKSHRRAYFLLANQRRVERHEKPVFVSPRRLKDMEPVPVEPYGSINLNAPVWAGLTPKSDGFTLFNGVVAGDSYVLPTYAGRRDSVERVLLTPITVTMDAAVAGAEVGAVAGVLYLDALAHDDCHDRR